MINNKLILFIDESGKPDFDDFTYRHFLLVGVIIPESELDIVSGYFFYIKRKYNLPLGKPFHTYQLLEEPASKLPMSEGKSFVKSMSEFIETCPIKIFLVHTDKITFQKRYKNELIKTVKIRSRNKGIVYFLSAYKLFQLFIDNLKKEKSTGSVCADSRYNQDRDLLDAFLKIRDAQFKGGVINPYAEKSKQRLTSITFANKFSLSGGLELTDFISFVIFAKTQRKLTQFDNVSLREALRAIEAKLISKRKMYGISERLIHQFSQ